MVDSGIKKSIISNSSLPNVAIDSDGPHYLLKYRIVSEDKNRFSHWSNINRVNFPSTSLGNMPYTSSSRIHLNTIGSSPETIFIIWNFPQEDEFDSDPEIAQYENLFSLYQTFDIFIRWNENNAPDNINWTSWKFSGTISAYSFSTLKPDPLPAPYNYTPKQIQASIQIPSEIKSFDDRLSLFKITHNI
jgi:hypothetical protein